MKASIDELIAKMDAASIFYNGDDCAGSNLWKELKSALSAPSSVSSSGPTAQQERLRFEGDLDRWMKAIGAGITGYQPEAYAMMDWACQELVRLRSEHATATALLAETQKVLLPFARDADAIHSDWDNERRRASLTRSEEVTVGHMRAAKALRNKIAALTTTATEGE